MEEQLWQYQGNIFNPSQIGDAVGFVYLIVNLDTGKKYIGKKLFSFAKTRAPLKGKINKRRSRVTSDWESYYGSNKELSEDVEKFGKEKFSRTILQLCLTKGTCSYIETKLIMQKDALIKDNYYNSWVSCKINKNQVKITS